jgi:uncharacterized integral membrane protein
LARLFQGLSVGGEYGTTATYMSEVALKGQRGFFASFQYVTLIGGQLLAVLVVVILQQLLSEDELRAWGWRIPFVVGAVAALISLLRRAEETSKEMREDKDAGSIAALFRDHKAAFITVLGYTAGGSLIFYTFTTYMQKYLVNTAGMNAKTASYVMTGALFLYMCMQPLFGMLADKIGRRNSMLCSARSVRCSPCRSCWPEDRQQPVHGLCADHPGAGDRQFLHLDQRPGEGRDVPAASAGAGRRPGLCGGQRDLRRFGRICGPGPEDPGHGKHFLLVRHRHDGGGFPVQPAPAQAGGVPASRSKGRYDTAEQSAVRRLLHRPGMREVFCDQGRLQGMLDFEAALARAEARWG